MFSKILLLFGAGLTIAIFGFLFLTYFDPWPMVFDTARCGESPLGFYRFQIVPYELTDYGGAEVQAGTPIGGLLDFVMFYFGQYDPCQ